uniref:Hexosyltransferase n=1 Tax=Cajanus cajan TaxID=3821 RepID=A0A151TDW2_CAJCA|nr:Glycogenin-1 [Cajanus cajan]
MRGPSPTTVEPRHRSSASFSEDTSKRRSQRSKDFKDVEKALHIPFQDRGVTCKPNWKLVLVIVILGTLVTIFHPPAVYNTDHLSNSISRPTFISNWKGVFDGIDSRYESFLNIEWDQISNVLENLKDKDTYQGVGLLNFNDSEIDHWKQLVPEAEHVVLHLNYASNNITWEVLYPEWIDEEEEYEFPVCPTLPRIQVPGKPRLDLIAVKLPCDKSGRWSRDVARLHLQIEAARLAASSKGYQPVHVLLVTDCFPIPNLFTCKELIQRDGSAWLYEPNLNTLREKLQLPIGSCELAVPLKAKENFYSERPHKEAYATILHSAQLYVCGAITAAQSIRMTGSTRDLVILVDETISDYHRGGLEAAGWKIHTIQRIRNPNAEPEAYNEWNYSKFRLWQLTDYDKIIFIDADLLILRNIDFLFEMNEISAIGNNATLFNSGVMVIEPSNSDPPILYVIHYLGNKPWLCFRDYDCNWNVDTLQEFASNVAHARWWKVHDAMPENLQKFCLLRSKQKAALEWDRRQAEKGNYSDGHWKIKIKDPRLETCFEDFCFWESMLWHWGEKNWTDNSTVNNSPPVIKTESLSSL